MEQGAERHLGGSLMLRTKRRPLTLSRPDLDTLVGIIEIADFLECNAAEAYDAIDHGLPVYRRRGVVHASRGVLRDWIARAERAARIGG